MIDQETLEKIKKKQYLEGKVFPEELHRLIHEFYENFDIDRQDNSYRENYIRHFIDKHEAFVVNYVTNIYNANINVSDNPSDNLTFNKFLDTIASYLTKYYEDEKDGDHDDYE